MLTKHARMLTNADELLPLGGGVGEEGKPTSRKEECTEDYGKRPLFYQRYLELLLLCSRSIEVIAAGLECHRGAQPAIDVTLRSPLSRDGAPRPQADWKPGAVSEAARHDKENKYPEFASSSRCDLVVISIEIGGRFSKEACDFIKAILRGALARAHEHRWSKMMAFSAANAFISSLLSSKTALRLEADLVGSVPSAADLVHEVRFEAVRPD